MRPSSTLTYDLHHLLLLVRITCIIVPHTIAAAHKFPYLEIIQFTYYRASTTLVYKTLKPRINQTKYHLESQRMPLP